jgi:hypothetical protein
MPVQQQTMPIQMHDIVLSETGGLVVVLQAKPDSTISIRDISQLAQSPAATRSSFGLACATNRLAPAGRVRPSGSIASHNFRYFLTSKSTSRHARALSEIDSLVNSKPSWAGRDVESPSRKAANVAKRVYRVLAANGLVADRIVASGDGGIALCFARRTCYADVEFLNSGELLACTEDRVSGATEIWEFSIDALADTVGRIRRFLAAHATSAV